jgi:hypothetical protein
MTAAAEALPLRALATLRALAPYAAIELLLPGGSLIALVLWLYRRYKKATPVQTDHGSHPIHTSVAGLVTSARAGTLSC